MELDHEHKRGHLKILWFCLQMVSAEKNREEPWIGNEVASKGHGGRSRFRKIRHFVVSTEMNLFSGRLHA